MCIYMRTHIHTHIYIYAHMYIPVYMHVCVCIIYIYMGPIRMVPKAPLGSLEDSIGRACFFGCLKGI